MLEEGVVVVLIDQRSGSLGAADIDGEGGHGGTVVLRCMQIPNVGVVNGIASYGAASFYGRIRIAGCRGSLRPCTS